METAPKVLTSGSGLWTSRLAKLLLASMLVVFVQAVASVPIQMASLALGTVPVVVTLLSFGLAIAFAVIALI